MLLIKELALIILFKYGVYKYTISCIYARKKCCSYAMETRTKVGDLLNLR